MCMFVWGVLCDNVWFVVGAVLMCRLICLCVAPVNYCVMLYGGLFFFVVSFISCVRGCCS